jgi:primosomal protein N' (replication factor Y)
MVPPKFADVLIPRHIAIQVFTYLIPETLAGRVHPGQRVIVSFGNKRRFTAVVVRTHDNKPDYASLKEVEEILDQEPIFSQHSIKLWSWLSAYYLCWTGDVLNHVIPSSVRLESESTLVILKSADNNCSADEKLMLDWIGTKKSVTLQDLEKKFPETSILKKALQLIEDGYLGTDERITNKAKRYTEATFLTLSPDYTANEALLHQLMDKLEKKAPKQNNQLLLFFMLAGQQLKIGKADFLKHAEADSTTIQALVKKGILQETEEKSASQFQSYKGLLTPIQLSLAQETAYQALLKNDDPWKPMLFRGVTGSGKTQLYAQLANHYLQVSDKGCVLLLLPEIAITTQLVHRLRAWFGDSLGVYHSRLPERERQSVWWGVQRGECRIVLGARSALFLPFFHLSLLIVDESHESSYKQQEGSLKYHGVTVAEKLASLHQAKLILGSATPTVAQYAAAKEGRLTLVELEERFGVAVMPHIQMVDLRSQHSKNLMRASFSEPLVKAMEQTLKEGGQSLVFLNRRGYAHQLVCQDCGSIRMCPRCDIGLVYHKTHQLYRCHYCAHTDRNVNQCNSCGSTAMHTDGTGTEKIEEELKILFPEARIDRLDADSAKSARQYYEIIRKMEQHNTDILLGTQMVTKGLDFPKLQLVGVLNADQSIFIPEYWAHERSFQLLSQVAGRAGRADGNIAQVYFQTFRPAHWLFQSIAKHDYVGFFQKEMIARRDFGYPPFAKLIFLHLRYLDEKKIIETSNHLANELRKHFSNVLGPGVPHINRVRNEYQREILLKFSSENTELVAVRRTLKQLIGQLQLDARYKSVRIQVDLDY